MGYDKEANNPIPLEVDQVIHFTAKGVLIRIGKDEIWLPRSQMEEKLSDSDLYELKMQTDAGTILLTFPTWLLKDKGLI